MIAIYARQSVDKKDSISIDSQIEYGKHEARDAKYVIYKDKGYSGKNTKRPAFEKMMKDVVNGKIEKVVVYRLDRISRSIVDFADFINKLESYNTSFVSATEKFDTSTPMGRAMLYIVVVFAQLERETIAERVKDNYYARVKSGAVGGGAFPYGFDLVRKVIDGKKMAGYVPNDDIENVIDIFKEYSKPNTSLADVQRFLIDNKILTASGKNWDSTKLSTLLKSPTYVKADINIYNYYKSKGAIVGNDLDDFTGSNGCVLVGKREANSRKYNDVSDHTLALSTHSGVIDSDTFLYVQQKLEKNKQIKNLHKGKHSWLTGYVKCGNCGYSFSVRKGQCKEGVVKYFYCSGRYLYKICDTVQTHRVDDVEEIVLYKIHEYIKEFSTVSPSKPKKDITKATNKKILEIDGKINALITNLEESSNVTTSYINQRIAKLDEEKKKHIKQLSDRIVEEKEKLVLPNYDYDNLKFDEKKELCRLLIKRIILTPEDVKIEWK